ncbi:D-hexose-6-phosphate mutarotase [Gallaecimonas kandeliae]|uniref:D-hexose-6-phosphate mutarotase n=1 Tax=Gallaecimonas kandeliae TaxID=3029055 RepID=UPI0026496F02|nr:D-hexose-6-phosphate mutarotase [Gallaecimonas kandeliae]WKE64611.1 D-hexose-6-phosphate mutarotase [Gallaecimonas kandeliae]
MSLPSSVRLGHTDSNLAYLDIDSRLCKARVFLQGAHLAQFQPKGQGPLLWLSPDEDFARGRAIRGGVPICWPWFGNDKPTPEAPAHGYARSCEWQLDDVEDRDGEVLIQLSLPMEAVPAAHWPHPCELSLSLVLGKSARLALTTTNLGDQPFRLTQALHSYFPVADIKQVRVQGLEGADYLEFGQGLLPQQGEVVIDREVDRQYLTANPVQRIDTGDGVIEVKREGSASLVLWNPWVDKAKALGQFPDDGYQAMLCLEAANVREDAVTLAPGQQHSLVTEISWANLEG